MAKGATSSKIKTIVKRTNQGGNRPKTSSMSKTQKQTYKQYRGQGK